MHMYVCIMSVCARARTCMRVFIFVSYDLLTYACMHVGPLHYVGMHE